MKIYLVHPAGDTEGVGGLSRAIYKCEHPLLLVSFADAHYRKHTKLVDLTPKMKKRPTKEKSK